MIFFDRKLVKEYLKAVEDENPIHDKVVPGQLIVSQMLKDKDWHHYKVRYKKEVGLDEPLTFKDYDDRVVALNQNNQVVIEINRA